MYAHFISANNIPKQPYISQGSLCREDLERVSLRENQNNGILELIGLKSKGLYIGVHNPLMINSRLDCGGYGADLIVSHAKSESKKTTGFVNFLDKKAYTFTRDHERLLGEMGLEWHDLPEVTSPIINPSFRVITSIENQGDPSSSRIF